MFHDCILSAISQIVHPWDHCSSGKWHKGEGRGSFSIHAAVMISTGHHVLGDWWESASHVWLLYRTQGGAPNPAFVLHNVWRDSSFCRPVGAWSLFSVPKRRQRQHWRSGNLPSLPAETYCQTGSMTVLTWIQINLLLIFCKKKRKKEWVNCTSCCTIKPTTRAVCSKSPFRMNLHHSLHFDTWNILCNCR